jgi:hypothetical protein
MIPSEKSAAVTRSLREAFGVTTFEEIREIDKGRTLALVYRIVVQGTPYLLRIISDLQMRMISPVRQFTCMQIVAEAGIAPRVHYASIEDGISITDFVEEVPFAAAEALVRMPTLLRALHGLPAFPKGTDAFDTSAMFLLHKGAGLDGFFQTFLAKNILAKAEGEQLVAWHAQLAAVYPQNDGDMVSSHNDLFKPDNILFDGNRVWLVDWEAAFLNDRYADLAVVANQLVSDDVDEKLYLERYFGQPPDEYQLARFFLMQQIVHIFYAVGFLLLGSAGALNPNEKAADFKAFNRRFWSGEINLVDKEMKTAYGFAHWDQLSKNMQRPERFTEALRIVAAGH